MKYYILLFIPFFFSCSDAVSITKDDFTSIVYSYHDSSVSPEYQRSFDITVTAPTEIHVQVDSYGDILATDLFQLTDVDLNSLIKIINEAELKSGDSGSNDCDGGSSESLTISDSSGKVYSGNFDNCGGSEIPSAFGDVESVIAEMKRLIPNLEEMLQ